MEEWIKNNHSDFWLTWGSSGVGALTRWYVLFSRPSVQRVSPSPMFTVKRPFLQASYQAIITPCLAAHVQMLCLSCRPKIPCTQGTPRKTLTCRAGCHISLLQAHGATCGYEKRSLGVQGGPLAGNGHMVPDVAHIFNQAQVLDLVARSNLQADVTCSAESGCVLRSKSSVGIPEPYKHNMCATELLSCSRQSLCCRVLQDTASPG